MRAAQSLAFAAFACIVVFFTRLGMWLELCMLRWIRADLVAETCLLLSITPDDLPTASPAAHAQVRQLDDEIRAAEQLLRATRYPGPA